MYSEVISSPNYLTSSATKVHHNSWSTSVLDWSLWLEMCTVTLFAQHNPEPAKLWSGVSLTVQNIYHTVQTPFTSCLPHLTSLHPTSPHLTPPHLTSPHVTTHTVVRRELRSLGTGQAGTPGTPHHGTTHTTTHTTPWYHTHHTHTTPPHQGN